MNKIFFSDIVGTFVSDEGKVNPKTVQAIKTLKKQKILFVFLTSQSPKTVKDIIKGVKADYFIGDLGESIYDKDLNLIHSIKSSNKGIAAKWLMDHLNIDPRLAGAAGDTKFDVPMFEEVEYSYAMGNGTDEAKRSAIYVTKNVEDDGLGLALEEFSMHMQGR